ncbi:hypothetical protein OIU78_008132 [Salix suchowensis]|nr:hypothetical protein OIU78_008132 [Salix suchowensis]
MLTKRNPMERHPCSFLAVLLIVSCSVVQIEAAGKRQGEALSHLYKAKYSTGNFSVDSTLFQAIQQVDSSKFHPQDGLKERDRIESLPGQPGVEFSQYGGYVTVDESAGRALYYYFVEAQHSNESLPLLLWLNGGTSSYLSSIVVFFYVPPSLSHSRKNQPCVHMLCLELGWDLLFIYLSVFFLDSSCLFTVNPIKSSSLRSRIFSSLFVTFSSYSLSDAM